MSLIPLLFGHDPCELYRPRYNYDLFGVTPREVRELVLFPRLSNLARESGADSFPATTVGKDGFQACIDVQQFKPNEITVKTVDNTVVVEANHEERPDEHGYISRHFVRKYVLPPGYDSEQVTSTLSSDGVLTVKAPPPKKDSASNERVIQIEQTGPAHLNVKKNEAINGEK